MGNCNQICKTQSQFKIDKQYEDVCNSTSTSISYDYTGEKTLIEKKNCELVKYL